MFRRYGQKGGIFQKVQTRLLEVRWPSFCRSWERQARRRSQINGTTLPCKLLKKYQQSEHPIVKRHRFPTRGLKKVGRNMHLHASETSKKVAMDLVGAANDFCLLHGLSSYFSGATAGRLRARAKASLVTLTTNPV